MSEEAELVRAGELGDKVKAFVESEIGQMLMAAKDIDEREAMAMLVDIDPYKYTTLIDLQNAIAKIQENVILARKVHGYLGDAIIRGDQADQLLLSEEN